MRNKWILPLANVLCLIHCVGIGLLSASAPLWLSGLHLEWVEYLLVGFNLIVGVKIFQTLPMPQYRIYILVAGLTVAFTGLLFELHEVYHWSIGLTAVYQIFTLIQFHKKKNHDSCECTHHQQKNVARLLNKWKNEPSTPKDEKNWAEFEKNLNKNRFNLPDQD